ncbi:hypothetical protein ACKI2N_012540 [Cupriavidus sp. 30B13]|uniref:hypothetical protein n=1 Tax=Cupriavidus sp. 30B13 TaxID=3384241 RepID=UPI003B90E64B
MHDDDSRMKKTSRWLLGARWLLTLVLGFVSLLMISELWSSAFAPDHASSAQGPVGALHAHRAREHYFAACAIILAAALSALWALWATRRDLWLRCLAGAPILTIWILAFLNSLD